MKPISSLAFSLLAVVPGVGLSLWSQSQAAEMQPVTLNFQGVVGDRPFACTESYRLGTADTMARAADFRLYVSEVALIDTAGQAVPVTLEQDGKWQYETTALLDFEDKTGACLNGTPDLRTQVVGMVPAGDYRGVRFTLGVPFALNHADATLAPSPLNLTSLWWNWRGGYKFMRVDLETHGMHASLPTTAVGDKQSAHGHGTAPVTDPSHSEDPGHGSEAHGFAIHLGSTGCQVDGNGMQPTQCLSPNRADIVLEDFNPNGNTITVDLAALVQSNNLEMNAPDTPPGCMSAPEDGDCMGIMHNLGLPFDGMPSSGQTVFRVE